MTETNKPTFAFEGTALLAYALHAQLLARRRATLEHDIKNVIHGLLSGTELLSKALTTSSPRIQPAECLSLLHQQVGRAQTTLHRMLDEIALDEGDTSTIGLHDLIEECAHDLRHQLQRFDWRSSIAPHLKIEANRARLKDALLGVLLEAIDRSRPQSSIAASAEAADSERVRLTFTHAPSGADLDIHAALAAILQAEDVSIDTASTDAERRITIVLPSADAATQSSGGRLVIVDANRDAADSLAMLVQLEGFEATAAYDVDSALHAVQSAKPVAMIVDVDGSIDSTALIAQLRGTGVRIIGLSHGAEIRVASVDAQLRKPLDPGALRSVLAPE